MSDIKLFSVKGEVKELPSKQVLLEKELQKTIEENMEKFFGVTFLKSEYSITNGRMDSIGIDENNCPVIFEYKRSMNENVINQGLFYLDWLMDHKADYKLIVMERLGKTKADAIDWSAPCVICIANDFTRYDVHAVNQMQRNIRLIKYSKFGEDLIAFEQINAPSVSSVHSNDSSNLVINNSEKKSSGNDKNFDVYFAEAGKDKQELFEEIKKFVFDLGDDISENKLKFYVALKKISNIICIEVYKERLLIHLKLNPDTVELKKGLIEDVRNKGHWGTGDLRLIVRDQEDFESVKPLLIRAYSEN